MFVYLGDVSRCCRFSTFYRVSLIVCLFGLILSGEFNLSQSPIPLSFCLDSYLEDRYLYVAVDVLMARLLTLTEQIYVFLQAIALGLGPDKFFFIHIYYYNNNITFHHTNSSYHTSLQG